MARTVKQWRAELTDIVRREGGRNVRFSHTGGTHLRVTADFTVKGGRIMEVSVTAALSPSCDNAGRRFTRDYRRRITEERERAETNHRVLRQ